jgi:hypothetical protein
MFLEFQVSLKFGKSNVYFTWRPMHIYYNISLIFRREKNVSDEICIETQNAYFMFSNLFPKILPFKR